MVWLSFLHCTSLCLWCDKNLEEFLMLCSMLWASCFSFLSINIYVCTWLNLLFVNNEYIPFKKWKFTSLSKINSNFQNGQMGVAFFLMVSLFGVWSNRDGELLAMEHVRTFSMFFPSLEDIFPKPNMAWPYPWVHS